MALANLLAKTRIAFGSVSGPVRGETTKRRKEE